MPLSRIDRGQLLERAINIQAFTGAGLHGTDDILESDFYTTIGPLGRFVRARIVGQDPPHNLRSYRKKVRAIAPVDSVLPDQADVGFVNERRWLESVISPFSP